LEFRRKLIAINKANSIFIIQIQVISVCNPEIMVLSEYESPIIVCIMKNDFTLISFICFMNLFEELTRKICTRGITLSEREFKNLHIKEIFNSITNIDFQDMYQAETILQSHIENGKFCLVEIAAVDNLFFISCITFEDIWSRNVFALKNMDYYHGFPDLITLYN
jgi:hypothetical protein